MGIQDRDYMRRKDDESSDPDSPELESRAEAFVGRFSRRYSGLFIFVGVALIVIVILALLSAPTRQ